MELFESFVQQIQQFWFAEINRREKVKIGDSVSFLQVSTTIRRNLEKPEDSRTRVFCFGEHELRSLSAQGTGNNFRLLLLLFASKSVQSL